MLPKTIEIKNKTVFLIDQNALPEKLKFVQVGTLREMYDAITTMVVRGAQAIGIAAAAGLVLFIEELDTLDKPKIIQAGEWLKTARPTAVNLAWAINKLNEIVLLCNDLSALKDTIWQFVHHLIEDDEKHNRIMGNHGASLIAEGKKINALTHCNAGSLATAYFGTALGVIRTLYTQGKLNMVYADETRPRMQGSKLTVWELMQDNIPVTLITDNMAAYAMNKGLIDAVLVGADRIAANGDTANKIGTYGLAILAKHHKIPFYVVASTSTIDYNIQSGQNIIIEERNAFEVTHIHNKSVTPEGVRIINPAFDITPGALITKIVTENGIACPDELNILQAHNFA